MRRALAIAAVTLAAAAAALGQTNVAEARKEMSLGSRAYREGRYAEAEQRFRRALELDPTQKGLPLTIARMAQQQYKPGDPAPENVAAGERAVRAYREILKQDPQNDDALRTIVLIYGQMRREEKAREFLLWRANDFTATAEKRAEAFGALARRALDCAAAVTERKENRKTAETPAGPTPAYTMPADQTDFLRARQCVTEGLTFSEQAVSLAPKSPDALAHRARLLREAAKLAEMEGDAAQKAEYERQYREATGQTAAGAAAGQVVGPTQMPEQGEARRVVSGGVLNAKAVSKPQPAYPPEAKAAGAQGVVTVQVLVDEEGRVVEAHAVSGHELLREAAVAAARNSRFSPTQLSGQPVRVSGVITYNFVLQ